MNVIRGINDINENNESELSIAEGANVLTRNKDEQVFLVLSYTLQGK